MSRIRFVGLDVHSDTIAVAVAEPDGEVRSLGVIPNRLESMRKLVAKLGPLNQVKACYEAGPTGCVVYWQLTALGVACAVVAPTLAPVKAGDRVKTDRRDAEKLARCYRAGNLTPVWVPDAAHEALGDLVRAREDAKQDQHRARRRLSKFLLRHGQRPPAEVQKNWTQKYLTWIKQQVPFDQPAPLGFALRGIDSTHPSLAARGIQRGTAEEFGVGFYRGSGLFSGRLVFPIHNERGELVAYCGRALDHSQPRYRFPAGFAKSEILFNLHRAASAGQPAVGVVEGFFDCLQLHQAGIRSVVALMGSALYESQQGALLDRFQRVILMLDGDAAGRRATAAITARLRPHCAVQLIHLAPDTQPDQMPSSEIRRVLQHQLPQPWEAGMSRPIQ
jgi:5S rRNA maturation endonuclease (ribonuclease M5)